MTREEAIDKVYGMSGTAEQHEALEFLVPEVRKLRESYERQVEDERMLREIKRYLKEQGDKPTGLPNGTVAVSDMIAWLEKQEEEEGYEAIPVESTLEYKLGFKAGKESEKQKEQKPWEWGEEETKLLDSIIDDYEAAAKSFCGYDGKIGLLRAIRDGEYDLPKQEWSEEDEKQIRQIERIVKDAGCSVKLQEQIHNWFESLYSSWKPSAQELGALKTAVSVLTEERTFPKAAKQIQKIIDVFDGKELRKDWKPSEEQMEYLSKAILTLGEEGDCKTAAVLNEMRDDLKKLM